MSKISLDDTYVALQRKIIKGEYHPSERLVEASIAKDLNSSRHHVRIAFERLYAEGLVHLEPNQGARVTSFDLQEVLDMFYAREALEVEAFRLGTFKITDAQIQELSATLKTMEVSIKQGDYELYSESGQRFHRVLFEASGNQTIPALIDLLLLRISRLRLRTVIIPLRGERSLREHQAILKAVSARDADGVAEAVRFHMSSLREDIEKYWDVIRP